ncbi:MAG: aldehyde ferredoxin oxidoreductase family protein [Firmicutes bacterium]|nr:aldehyde ferredoxin oxidoreductase family protein [Bacillota bacterium]
MGYGYFNRLLRVDLTKKTIEAIRLPEEYWRKYVGGKCLGSRLLLDYELYKYDPLAEENYIFMLVGPLTGSVTPGVGKTSFFSRSLLTGGYLDSTCGGRLAHNLKSAGYDGVMITGQSEVPVYLSITDHEARLESAKDLWGKGCFETESILKSIHGRDASTAVIGPAGENLVKYATVHADFYHQAGRGGVGALFGAKKLKGIVVSGGIPVPYYRPRELFAEGFRLIRESRPDQKVRFRIRYGTMSTLDLTQKLGIAVVRNFTDGVSDRYDLDLNRDYLKEHFVVRDLGCFACPVPCGKGSEFEYQGTTYRVGGPEYETMSLIGTNLEVKAEELLYLNWLCDDLGIDTISGGVTLGCAAEAYARGLLDDQDLGLSLKWGDGAGFAKAFRAIAYRQGVGALLAEGSRRFAQEIGLDRDTAIQVKGMEIAGYDPRGTTGYALEFAVADRGGCHRRARPIYKEQDDDAYRFSYEGKGKMVKELEDQRAFYHSLIICDFIPSIYPLKVKEYAGLLSLATGWEISFDKAVQIGERAMNQSRLFNVYCGIRRKDDILPGRFFNQPLPRGRAQGQVLEPARFQQMLSDYYAARGWDEDGVPTAAKLEELGIGPGNLEAREA